MFERIRAICCFWALFGMVGTIDGQRVGGISSNEFNRKEWVEIKAGEGNVVLDVRYATVNNFVKARLYPCGRVFLRPDVAIAFKGVLKELGKRGLGIKVFDAYRPRLIQQKLWDMKPDAQYVANPKKGSMHNRGMALDITLTDRNGAELDMGTPYDYFGERAHSDCVALPKAVLANRKALSEVMGRFGFRSTRTEWWHYSYKGQVWPLSDWVWGCAKG